MGDLCVHPTRGFRDLLWKRDCLSLSYAILAPKRTSTPLSGVHYETNPPCSVGIVLEHRL